MNKWGYTVSLDGDTPVVSTLPFALCTEGAPPADVDTGRNAWNSAAVEGRVPVAN